MGTQSSERRTLQRHRGVPGVGMGWDRIKGWSRLSRKVSHLIEEDPPVEVREETRLGRFQKDGVTPGDSGRPGPGLWGGCEDVVQGR